MKSALYRIGMGCQVFDDIVDLLVDIRTKRHNYVASCVHERMSAHDWSAFAALARRDTTRAALAGFYADHPAIGEWVYGEALGFLKSGLHDLFSDEHAFLIDPAIRFISARIGVDAVLGGTGPGG